MPPAFVLSQDQTLMFKLSLNIAFRLSLMLFIRVSLPDSGYLYPDFSGLDFSKELWFYNFRELLLLPMFRFQGSVPSAQASRPVLPFAVIPHRVVLADSLCIIPHAFYTVNTF
jgi:hypothetical protein